jgi:DNA-binding transcriptional regulator YiaG
MKTNSKGSPAYNRLRKAVTEMKQVRRGERAPSRAFEVLPDGKGGFIRRMVDPEQARERHAETYANTVVTARTTLKLSQDKFATLLGISVGTLRGWEQGRRKPNRAAEVLLRVAMKNPKAVLEAAGTV